MQRRSFWTLTFVGVLAGIAQAQVADYVNASQVSWGVGDNLPLPYTQADMNVTIEVRIGIFWTPFTQNVGVDEAILTKTAGSPNFSIPLSSINSLFTSPTPINLNGTVTAQTVNWSISQTISQTGGFVVQTEFMNGTTTVPVNVVVNNLATSGQLRSIFSNVPVFLNATLAMPTSVRGTHSGGDPVNFIDVTAGSASGTVGGVPINGLRIRYRNIQHIMHVPTVLRINGAVTLNDVIAQPASFIAQATLLSPTGTTVLASAPVTVTSGNFVWQGLNVLPGSYRLRIQTGSHLARTLNINLGTSTTVSTALVNGDVDRSGEVDAADIDGAIANFGTSIYGPTVFADVDRSGEVDAGDLDIIISRFGEFDN